MTPLEKKLLAAIKAYPIGTTMDIIAEELSIKFNVDRVKLYHWPRGDKYRAETFPC
jgi:hypothetical protein